MVEVTRKNFEALLPEIAEKICEATFVAVDAEYTGIHSEDLATSNTLFDSGSERYEKARDTATKFTTCQYGLAIFTKHRHENTYRVDPYRFYLYPTAFDSFAKRELLNCQLSAINFLARHNFDFNKFFREGVPHLNKGKSESLRSFLKMNRHFLKTAEETEHYDFLKNKDGILDDEDIEDFVNYFAGFSKVIDVISEARIPVIGHNFYTDLLLTHHQFISKLPDTYEAFKASVHECLPVIYDTKYLAREVHYLRREMGIDDEILYDTNLFALYTNICSKFGMNLPVIVTSGGDTDDYHKALAAGRQKNLESVPDTFCHSADFDAVVTGCIFLFLSTMAYEPEAVPTFKRSLPPTFSELLGKTECWSNRVNLARAIIPYIDLAGPDPQPHRPNWILVKSINLGKFIDPVRLKLDLVKYGDIEIEAVNPTEVIIACGAMGCYRNVWRELAKRGFTLEKQCFSSRSDTYFSNFKKYFRVALGTVGAVIAVILARKQLSNP